MSTGARAGDGNLPPMPPKRWAMFCTKCHCSGPCERPTAPSKSVRCDCGYAAFAEEQAYSDAEMRSYALAALAAAPAVSAPAGWQLVPIEPTPEMVGAMAVEESTGSVNGTPTIGMAGAVLAYEAMLAAAPGFPCAVTAQGEQL